MLMANKEHLRNIDEYNKSLTPEERKKNASKAGKASAEARKERKLIKERILERMNESDWDEMIDGLKECAKDSDKAFELLRDTIGEKPTDKVAVSIGDKTLDRMRGDFDDV